LSESAKLPAAQIYLDSLSRFFVLVAIVAIPFIATSDPLRLLVEGFGILVSQTYASRRDPTFHHNSSSGFIFLDAQTSRIEPRCRAVENKFYQAAQIGRGRDITSTGSGYEE
jgi:hypothetical protein